MGRPAATGVTLSVFPRAERRDPAGGSASAGPCDTSRVIEVRSASHQYRAAGLSPEPPHCGADHAGASWRRLRISKWQNCTGAEAGREEATLASVGFILRYGAFDFIDLADLLRPAPWISWGAPSTYWDAGVVPDGSPRAGACSDPAAGSSAGTARGRDESAVRIRVGEGKRGRVSHWVWVRDHWVAASGV